MKLPAVVYLVTFAYCAHAQNDSLAEKQERFTFHFQETTVSQYRPAFHASYTGEHSQTTNEEWATTLTSSIFAGLRLWPYATAFINPEIAGGSGLSSAFGIAAFTNGEAFRVGNPKPTIYLARGFFNQIIPLSKEREWQNDDENQIKQQIPKKYISISIGKISIADYFDDNTYSHDPRSQFMSWGLMSNGAWDYPANTRGYTPSAVIEYISQHWEARYALSMMPTTANGNTMDENISKANANTFELKYKYELLGKQGKISALAFLNFAKMGLYSAANISAIPDSSHQGYYIYDYTILASEEYGRKKFGFGLNIEQALNDNIGTFARASYNDGKTETWCFTEIDRAFSMGVSIKGNYWKRKNDTFGIAYCISGLSNEHAAYLANGGLGFIIGDGKLNYGNEHLTELYYSLSLMNGKFEPSVVYQFVVNPAYNKDRGYLNIYSIRLHFSL